MIAHMTSVVQPLPVNRNTVSSGDLGNKEQGMRGTKEQLVSSTLRRTKTLRCTFRKMILRSSSTAASQGQLP